MVEESFADFGSLKIDRAWPALDLFSVVKEGDELFLKLSPKINHGLLAQATNGRYTIGVSIFGRGENKAYLIDELIRLTNKQQMTSDRIDPKGVRIWPVTGTIDGKQVAIMFMIGEAAGVLGTTHEYEVKIQEACLSLCHIGLLNVIRTIGSTEIFQLLEAFGKVKNHEKQLTYQQRRLCILGRDASFMSHKNHENPTFEEGDTMRKRMDEAFPGNKTEYIVDINQNETVFRKNLADFANVLSSHIREVIQNETEGAYKPEALSFTTFWKVLKSFKKRPSESEDARKVFKQKIEDEKAQISDLINRREEGVNPKDLIKEFSVSFHAQLTQMRDQFTEPFEDCEVVLKNAISGLTCDCHGKEAAELDKRMTRVQKTCENEILDLLDDLDEIEEWEELNTLKQRVQQSVTDAREQILVICKESTELQEVIDSADNLRDGLFRSGMEWADIIRDRLRQLERQKQNLDSLDKQEMQFLSALQNVKFRGLRDDPFLWNGIHYRDQVELWAQSGFEKHLLDFVVQRGPTRKPCAQNGKRGYEGSNGKRGQNGMKGANGTDGMPGASGIALAFVLEGTPEELHFTNWLNDPVNMGKDCEDVWLIDLRGQDGGNGAQGMKGGNGGMGIDGLPGVNGQYIEDLNGKKGGKGGNGGRGGDGGHGGNGGDGGILYIETKKPELLMLLEFDLRGGFGGRGGLGGVSGLPGRGGPGGQGFVQEAAGMYSLQGFHGRPGPYGEPGGPAEWPSGLNGHPGRQGVAGRFIVRVEASGDSAIDEYGIGRYDVEVESFDIEPVVDDGIIEQNEVIAVKNIVIKNTGGITLPEGAVLTFESKNEDIRPISEPIPLPSLTRGFSKQLDDIYYFRVHQWVSDVPFVGRMRSQCFFHSKARLLGRSFLTSVREGNVIVKSPVTVSNTEVPKCASEGATTRLSFWVTNESKFPHGAKAHAWGGGEEGDPAMLPSDSSRLNFEILAEEDVLIIKSCTIIDESKEPEKPPQAKQRPKSRGLSPLAAGSRASSIVLPAGEQADIEREIFATGEIPLINPSASYRIDLEVELADTAPVGHQCQVVFTLKHRERIVENRHVSVRATKIFNPSLPPADVLYFSLPHQSETELCGWTILFKTLSLSCQFWDVEGHKGISYENGDKNKKRDCSFWSTHEGSILIFPFRDRNDLDLLHPNDVLAFLSCQPLPLPLCGDDVSIVQGRVHPGSVIFLGLKKNVIYQWLFSSPLCSVGLKEMKVPPKSFGRLTGKLRNKAIASGEKKHHDLYRLNAEIQRYDNFAAMDESAFYDIQADQDYDWEKDGNAIEEIEETEMVEQEVDPDSVYGVANPELRHNEAKSTTTTTAGTVSSSQGSTVTTTTLVTSSASTADSMKLGQASQASSDAQATALVEKSTKTSSVMAAKNERAEKLQAKVEQDLFLSKDGAKINAFAVYEKLPLPSHTKLFTITSQTLPSLCCNEIGFTEDMKDAIVEEMFDIDGDTLDNDIHSSLTFLIFVSQLHDILSTLLMAMSPAKKLATAKNLLDHIEAEKGVDEGDLETADITTVSSEASSATEISDTETDDWDEYSESTHSISLEVEEDELAEEKRYELEAIENSKKAEKIKKQKKMAKFPETPFGFEKPWEWQFYYLKKNKGLFKKNNGVSQHNLVQMLFSSIVEDLSREGDIVKHSFPIRSQFRSLIQYKAKVGISASDSPTLTTTSSSPQWSSGSSSSSSSSSTSPSSSPLALAATNSAPGLSRTTSSSFSSESAYGVGAPKEKKRGFNPLKRTQSVASSFSEHDEKILRNRYKKEMGALKNDKTAYFLERAASNDLDMIKYLVESKQMKTTSTLKSVPKKNPMNLKKGESLTDVLKRSDSKEVASYIHRLEAKVEETKMQAEVAKKKSVKIVSFAPEFPALQDTLDFLTSALEADNSNNLMFQCFAREILSRLRKVLPPQRRMVLKKDDLEKAIGALKLTTNGATKRDQKLIKKYTKEMKLKAGDFSLEKMRMYSGIHLPFYESLALVPLRDLKVKEVKKEVTETAVGRRRYAVWQPTPIQGLNDENLKLRNDPKYFPYPSHHHPPLPY